MAVIEADETGPETLASMSLEALLGKLLVAIAAAIADASQVSLVLASLRSLASLLWPVPVQLLPEGEGEGDPQLDAIEKQIRAGKLDKVADVERGYTSWQQPAEGKLQIMNQGQTFMRKQDMPCTKALFFRHWQSCCCINLLDAEVAPDWLACFPSSQSSLLFDDFFKQAPAREALLALAPSLALDHKRVEDSDMELESGTAISFQARRLLNICLIEQQGVKEIALSFGHLCETTLAESGANIGRGRWHQDAVHVAQLVTSIPDRAGMKALASLQSPFYQSLAKQMVTACEEHWQEIGQRYATGEEAGGDGAFIFIGGLISSLCRRGQADVIASGFVPVLIEHIQLASGNLEAEAQGESSAAPLESVKLSLQKTFWSGVTVSVKDSHAMERWVEALLRELAVRDLSDWQAYCILYMCFGCLLPQHTLTRMVFMEKFLFIKVFPIRILKWILQLAVLQSPPIPGALQSPSQKQEKHLVTEVVKRLAQAWSSNDFIRSASLPKQAYLTAAVGMCVRAMEKGDMENYGNLMQSLLQGVTNRLDSPLPLVRQMAKRVALAFSLVINPDNPLLLDDDEEVGDLDDWEGLERKAAADPREVEQAHAAPDFQAKLDASKINNVVISKTVRPDPEKREIRHRRRERREKLALEEDDPDAVVNLGEDNSGWLEEDERSDEDLSSDSASEGSLQPYDMSDDESELEKQKLPSQLRDCIANLQKPDDSDAVQKALQVAEKLVRARPVELDISAGELAYALVHVRCSAIAVEGEEDFVEENRCRALVALLACASLSTVVILTRELYSPHVDISQRILILDVMSDAAQELAQAGNSIVGARGQARQHGLVTELFGPSHRSPWYGPGHQYLAGAGPWSEVPALMPGGSMVGWAQRYERELPLREGDQRLGKPRKWAPRSMQLRAEKLHLQGGTRSGQAMSGGEENLFAPVAAAFMLPIMRDYDKKSHGVDFLGSGFIVLGKLLYTLGVCIECITAQPEAAVLGVALLDLLKSRVIANHTEAYVRRAALYAASRIILALHPSQVVFALTGTDSSIATGLEWVREWALGIADNDPDAECSRMAMTCVQLHSEMALQAMRSLQTQNQVHSQSIQTSVQLPTIRPF